VVTLNAKEQLKLDVVSRVFTQKVKFETALKILNCSERTLYRYLKRFKTEGALFVKHKNTGKNPANKTNLDLEQNIVEICKDRYHDFNRTHALEFLADKEKIKIPKDTFNRICNRNNILNKRLKKRRPKIKRRRDRMPEQGLMIQLDGSPHRWFGFRKTCLVIAIDDANSEIVYGEFSPTETTFACMNVIKGVLREKGSFEVLYVDKAGIYGRDPLTSFSTKRDGFSNMKERLKTYDIKVIFAHSPEAKGRVERAFNTLQDRLIAELRLNNINNIEDANKYLREVYLPAHNRKFSIPDVSSSYVPVIGDLDKEFYMSIKRVIKNDHTFRNENVVYDILRNKKNYAGKEVEIRSYPDGKVLYFVDDIEISLKEVEEKQANAG
jgi:transposase